LSGSDINVLMGNVEEGSGSVMPAHDEVVGAPPDIMPSIQKRHSRWEPFGSPAEKIQKFVDFNTPSGDFNPNILNTLFAQKRPYSDLAEFEGSSKRLFNDS